MRPYLEGFCHSWHHHHRRLSRWSRKVVALWLLHFMVVLVFWQSAAFERSPAGRWNHFPASHASVPILRRRQRVRGRRWPGVPVRERSLRQHRRLVPLRLQEGVRRVPQAEPLRGCVDGRRSTGPARRQLINRVKGQRVPDWSSVFDCTKLSLLTSPVHSSAFWSEQTQ